MVVLAVLVASYALAVPFLQDDLTRRSQRTQQQQGNNGLTPPANPPNRQDDKQKNAGQQDNKPKKPVMEVKAQAVAMKSAFGRWLNFASTLSMYSGP